MPLLMTFQRRTRLEAPGSEVSGLAELGAQAVRFGGEGKERIEQYCEIFRLLLL